MLVAVVIALALGSLNLGTSSQISSATTAVVQRAESTVSTTTADSGNLGYRTQLDNTMLQVLGARWPVGLGFLDPTVHYVPELPNGAIRNADVGIFNVLMTMGAMGAVLIYGCVAARCDGGSCERFGGQDGAERWVALRRRRVDHVGACGLLESGRPF